MPDRIGKYEIRGEIGKGGFGKVYRGFDPTVGRLVAIKVLSSDGDPSLLARFRTEATAAGNLHHKNIVTVFEFGEDHGTFFLVMEYLEGQDLQHVLPRAHSLPLVDKMNIMSQVAEGLQCAHQNGIVHRDVKPANIMLLADGTVKIMDFGIARLTHANSARLTQSGFLIGTLTYMAPELLNGAEADALCDIWAFGTIYYELLAGQHPFEAADAGAAMYRIMSGEPQRIRALVPDCPEALDNVIFRLLAKDRESRYQSLEDVLFDTAPILLDLESHQARGLLSQAKGLILEGKLEEAEPLIRKILTVDPLHQEGRALRKELQTGLKKRSVQVRVQILCEQSEKFVAAQNLGDAIRSLESALALDSGNTVISGRVKELRASRERLDISQRLMAQARSDFEQNNLTSAFQAASDAIHAEPLNSEARVLLGEIRERMTERDSEKRLREGLSKVRGLIALQSFDEAIAAIENLQREGVASEEMRELLERTRQQNAERKRSLEIRSEIEAAKEAIKHRRFEEAVAKLGPLAGEPVCKAEVAGLLAYAGEELALAERANKIKALGKEAWALFKSKDYGAALARVESGLQAYPDESMLLKLRQAILTERAQEERRAEIQHVLDESGALDRAGRLEEALAPLEKALWKDPEEASLRAALDQLKKKIEEKKQAERLAALDQELKQAHRLLDEGQPGPATQLLQNLTVAYPDQTAVAKLLDRARVAEQRRTALEGVYADIRRLLQGGRPEEALEAIQRAKSEFGAEPQLVALEAEAERARKRDESLEQARQAHRARDWAGAENLLTALLAAHPGDREAQGLLGDVRNDRAEEQRHQEREQQLRKQREQQQQLREKGRKEAAQLLLKNRFDEAATRLRSLCEQFPEDAALREDLRSALEAKERYERREAFSQGRKQADALLAEGSFDAAIAAIQALLAKFPQEAALRDDLKAAEEARAQQQRKARYHNERQRALELVRNRKLDEAIGALEAMRQQFPGDSQIEEDLRSAHAAKGYQTERFQVNERVAKLEQYYRQGKPAMVKQLATELLAEIEEPRARELLHWAEEMLARPPSGIQPGVAPAGNNRYLLWGGIAAVLLVGGVILLFALRPKAQPAAVAVVTPASDNTTPPASPNPVPTPEPAPVTPAENGGSPKPSPDPHSTARITLEPEQVTFDWQTGSPVPGAKTVAVRSSGSTQHWKAEPNKGDAWILVAPSDSALTVGIDPSRLPALEKSGRGVYSSVILVTLEGAQATLSVRLTVTPAAVTPPPQPQPPPLTPVDCGPAYPGKKQEDLRWTGDLKPGAALLLGLRKTVVEGGGTMETYGLPGCDVVIDPSTLTSGIKIEEAPGAQNQFQRMRLRNTTTRSIGSVSFHWKMK